MNGFDMALMFILCDLFERNEENGHFFWEFAGFCRVRNAY